MKRKDCDQDMNGNVVRPGNRHGSCVWIALAAVVLPCAAPAATMAGVVRIWPQAVVVTDVVELADVAILTGFDASTEQAIANLVVADAPRAGGTRIIHIAAIRTALSVGGANLASIQLGGAIRCTVSRPATDLPNQQTAALAGTRAFPPHKQRPGVKFTPPASSEQLRPESQDTLRQAVIDYFDRKLARFGGRAEVLFDRRMEQTLDLSAPNYMFWVSQQKEQPVGLVAVDVEIASQGQTLRTIQLVLRVTMLLDVVTAKRPVNQGSTIDTADVGLVAMALSHVDDIPLSDMSQVVGQRAKRFVPVGTPINAGMLEAVPLVRRGQLITLIARAGSVSVVTTGKAAEDGMLGEIINVRSVENRRDQFDATVTGPGEATLGRIVTVGLTGQLASRSGRR